MLLLYDRRSQIFQPSSGRSSSVNKQSSREMGKNNFVKTEQNSSISTTLPNVKITRTPNRTKNNFVQVNEIEDESLCNGNPIQTTGPISSREKLGKKSKGERPVINVDYLFNPDIKIYKCPPTYYHHKLYQNTKTFNEIINHSRDSNYNVWKSLTQSDYYAPKKVNKLYCCKL